MKKQSSFAGVLILCSLTILAACGKQEDESNSNTETQPEETAVVEEVSEKEVVEELPAEEKPEPRETKGVTYTGKVKTAGISVYQEGTHRLVLEDGKFILLESNGVDLNGYVGEQAELYGAIRPTVEEGGMIMRVERISLIATEEEGDEEAVEEVDVEEDFPEPPVDLEEDETDEVEDAPLEIPEAEVEKAEPKEETDTTSSSEATSSSEESSDSSESSSEESSESSSLSEEEVVEEPAEPEPTPVSPEKQALIDTIAKENIAAERWTQEYCTGHIGFCIPVHKNWWYQSFGNTTEHFWHVELSSAPLEQINDGVIVVKLVSGTVGSKKATDGQVRIQGNQAIGFRSWEGNQHFEIVGDASVVDSIRYIVDGLKEYSDN